jgi:hypothetical protein
MNETIVQRMKRVIPDYEDLAFSEKIRWFLRICRGWISFKLFGKVRLQRLNRQLKQIQELDGIQESQKQLDLRLEIANEEDCILVRQIPEEFEYAYVVNQGYIRALENQIENGLPQDYDEYRAEA